MRTVPGGQGWESVTTVDTESLTEELELGQSEDSRQTYLNALFAPGAFLASTLAKTVAIFRRSLDREVENFGWERLKQEVVSAVESEVQSSMVEYEVSDEEFVAASTAAWARFHSCACQYRATGLQPMGLVASPSSSSLILIRRELVSWLRPVEALEQVVISGGQGFTPDVFRDISPISDDPGLAQDVLHLLMAAGKVGKLLPPSTMAAFNEAVTRLNSPDVVSRSIAADLLAITIVSTTTGSCFVPRVICNPRGGFPVPVSKQWPSSSRFSSSNSELTLPSMFSNFILSKSYTDFTGSMSQLSGMWWCMVNIGSFGRSANLACGPRLKFPSSVKYSSGSKTMLR